MSNNVTLPATGAVIETFDPSTTAVTTASTAAGSAVLTFASVPREVTKGMVVTDQTAGTVIPGATTVLSYTDTTVTLSANTTGAGVGNGDTIVFTGGQRQVMAESSQGYSASASFTRPADTAAYLALDVLGSATGSTAALQFVGMGPANRDIMLTGAQLEIDAAAIITGETSYTLHLYKGTPPSALGDNAPWDLPSGDRAAYLGYINLGTPSDLGSTLYCEVNGINKQVKLSSGDLFGYVVTNGAYTPTSARGPYKITLHSVRL